MGYVTGKYNLEKQLKSKINYQFLYSQAAKPPLRGVAEAFKSYKELSKKYNKGELADCSQLPKYRQKGGMGVITYPKQALKLEKCQVRVPLGKKVKALLKNDSFFLDFPSNLEFKEIR